VQDTVTKSDRNLDFVQHECASRVKLSDGAVRPADSPFARKLSRFTRFDTIRTVIFLIVGKLDFRALNPRASQPT
jgi:hypothetical protein